MNTYERLALLMLFYPAILLFSNRLLIKKLAPISGQKAAVFSVFVSSGVLILVAAVAVELTTALAIYLAYASLGIGYVYFHFFNMSETARRIKILTGIHARQFVTQSDVEAYYAGSSALHTRIKRLSDIGQLRLQNGRFQLNGRILLRAAQLIMVFRSILKLNQVSDVYHPENT